MRTVVCVTILALPFLLSGSGVYAAEYHVNQDGTGDYTAIQEAIDAAANGDEIIVHPGTYYENIRFDGKNITLRSVAPEDKLTVASTVIDGQHRDSVVKFAGTEDKACLLAGFTIVHGLGGQGGGGIRGGSSAAYTRATIDNCTIMHNFANAGYGQQGGGLCYCSGAIMNCTIAHNRACGGFGDGGGLAHCGGPISNCTISNNKADLQGGGLYRCNGKITSCTISGNCSCLGGGLCKCNGMISDCMVNGNKGSRGGGGLSCCEGTVASCTIMGNSTSKVRDGGGLDSCCGSISNCTITSNSAGLGGGLCDFNGTITDCTITGNLAGWGGGLYGCDAMVTNCVISGNCVNPTGGGGLADCVGTVANCTIAANTATGAWASGGALRGFDGTVSNCIVWGNDAPSDPDIPGSSLAEFTITHSCIKGNWTHWGEGNISDDPLFVTGPLGDYYLSCEAAGQGENSPCIDAGSDTAEALGLDKLTTRTDGVPDAGVVDMGCHYPDAPPASPTIGCFLNDIEFAPGDQLVGSLEVANPGPEIVVDVYVAFVLPDGTTLCLTSNGLVDAILPWAAGVALPEGLDYGPEAILSTSVPIGLAAGDYMFAAALSEPGELSFIGDLSFFPFTIEME